MHFNETTMLTRLRRLFIPHRGNGHRPHALRPRALAWYVGLVIVVKLAVMVLVFLAYPDAALLVGARSEEIVRMINAARVQARLPALIADPALMQAASEKATDMLARQYFEHVSPDGVTPPQWLEKTGYRFLAMGENLAVDFATTEHVHDALMRSATHRGNILAARYRHVGIGIVTGDFRGRRTNLLVEFFAEPTATQTLGSSAAAPPRAPLPSVSAVPRGFLPTLSFAPSADARGYLSVGFERTRSIARGGQRILYAALVYLTLALLLNVFVRVRVQRASLIAQTLAVIFMVAGLAMLDVPTIDALTRTVRVL